MQDVLMPDKYMLGDSQSLLFKRPCQMFALHCSKMASPPILVVLSLAIAFSDVLSVLGAPSTSFTNNWASGNIGNDDSVESSSFHISSKITNINNEKCSHKVRVVGKGVSDTFDLVCDEFNGVTSLQSDTYALYDNPLQNLSFYTDQPSTLVVVKDGTCTKRTYKTSKGKTTYEVSDVNNNECADVKQKMDEKKEENRKYWEQWQKDFDNKMKKQFPPCFPFCVEEKPEPSEEKQTSHSKDDSSEEITETDKTSPEYWRQWQKKFDAKMKKKFPPCFPFCDDKKTPKSGDKDKKNDKPKQNLVSDKSDHKPSDDSADVDDWNF